MTVINREDWLSQALPKLAVLVNERTEFTVKGGDIGKTIKASCGWPRHDSNGKVIGECWPVKASKGTVSAVFISPLLDDPIVVLGVLLHEMIHALDDCAHAHAGPFVRAIRALGFGGKPTATVVEEGSELERLLKGISKELGKYPHTLLDPGKGVKKPQGTRMIKCECEDCGYVVRTTKKWLDLATPVCPVSSCFNYREALHVEIKGESE